MKNEVDIQWVLQVVNKIHASGTSHAGDFRLNGLIVSSDADGYNVSIEDGRCSLHLGFQNTYDLHYPDDSALQSFWAKMEQVLGKGRR
ncbi:DUF3081 family protein [Shewanella sp. GXUN23E]|uniref:DUF3081 family protein n=1 Tax=Shewanella sp. GXUN23E TaxID=3422498 RepID=UPI003D7E10E4